VVIQVSDTSETDVIAEMFHVTSTAFLHVRCYMYTVLCCIVMISHCLFAVLSLPTLVLNVGSIGSISICIEILLIRLALETLGTESLRKVLGMLYNRCIDVTVSCMLCSMLARACKFIRR